MKKARILAMILMACSGSLIAQENKEIKKEVRMEDENGVKTLFITTTEKGVVTEETYTGEEAEIKMAELMEGRGENEEVTKEIEVEVVDGEKVVTIITSTKGKMRKEVYTGAEADAKLLELENAKSESGVQSGTIKERGE